MMWSMYKTAHIDPESDLAKRFPNAVSHDGENTVYVAAPDDLTGAFIVPADLELAELIYTVGNYLVSQTDAPLIATKDQLVTLFNTPQHRLWCAQYESETDPVFMDDKLAAGISGALTREQAKAAIKQAVTP